MLSSISGVLSVPLLYLRSAWRIIFDRKLITLCAVPYLIGAVSYFVFLYLSYAYRDELASLLISDPDSWWHSLLSWSVFFVNIFISGLLAILSTLLLGAFFIDLFVEEVMKRKQLPVEECQTASAIIRSIVRGLKDDLRRLLYVVFILILVFIAGFFPLFIVIPPLLTAFLAGYDLIDLPFALMGIRFRDRWKIAKQKKIDLLALGAVFMLIMLIPLGAIFLLPVAYYAAVERIAAWQLPLEGYTAKN